MSLRNAIQCFGAALLVAFALGAQAQPMPYGSITLEQAKKAIEAAVAEAKSKNLPPLSIAVVDSGGHLVAFEKMDNAAFPSVAIAQDKAWSAAGFRIPTKVFFDAVSAGGAGLRLLGLRGANVLEGGLPLVVDGKVIGGIGASGAPSGDIDAIAARAGANALK